MGWGKVAVRWLACIGPDGFQTISFIFWLMYAQLTENVFTTFLFGCIEVSLQRNVV